MVIVMLNQGVGWKSLTEEVLIRTKYMLQSILDYNISTDSLSFQTPLLKWWNHHSLNIACNCWLHEFCVPGTWKHSIAAVLFHLYLLYNTEHADLSEHKLPPNCPKRVWNIICEARLFSNQPSFAVKGLDYFLSKTYSNTIVGCFSVGIGYCLVVENVCFALIQFFSHLSSCSGWFTCFSLQHILLLLCYIGVD